MRFFSSPSSSERDEEMGAKSTLLLAALLLASSCRESGSDTEPCEEGPSFPGGFFPTGLDIAPNGKGFLTGIADFVDCESATARSEGRVIAIDVQAQTGRSFPLDYLPGEVLVSDDGIKAVIMAHYDRNGLDGAAPLGVTFVDGDVLSVVDLGNQVFDLDRHGSVGLVSAGAAGTWQVNLNSGEVTQVSTQRSFCGVMTTAGYHLCDGAAIRILDTSGSLVSTISLPSDVVHLDGTAQAIVALAGASAFLMTSDTASLPAFSLDGDVGFQAFVNTSGTHALVRGSPRLHHLDIAAREIQNYRGNLDTLDVEFANGRAFIINDYNLNALDLETKEVESFMLPDDSSPAQLCGFDGGIIVAESEERLPFAPGDSLDTVIRVFHLDGTWDEPWGFTIE